MRKSNLFSVAGRLTALLALMLIARSSSATLTLGYFPTDTLGHGTAYLRVDNEELLVGSYRLELRRVTVGVEIVHQFVVPTAPVATFPTFLGVSTNFTLPLNTANPRSWEIDMQYRVRAYSSTDGTGSPLYNSDILACAHPSTTVGVPVFTALPVNVGSEALTINDGRSTASQLRYTYDVFQKFTSAGQSQIDSFNNGILPAPTSQVHGALAFPRSVPIVSGDQIYFVQSRGGYNNSLGTFLGKYGVAPKSPNTASVKVP